MARWQSPQTSALLGGFRSIAQAGEENINKKAHTVLNTDNLRVKL